MIINTLAETAPQPREQLRRLLRDHGVPTDGQAIVHILVVATATGAVVRGPMAGADQAFVAVPHWVGPAPKAVDREEALARLARRYLAGHAPAGAPDLAKWAGLPLGDARQGLAAIADEVVPAGPGMVAPAAGPGVEAGPGACPWPYPRRGCSVPLTPSSTAGRPGGPSSAITAVWSPSTAFSAPWR